jgi:hypothetical protein
MKFNVSLDHTRTFIRHHIIYMLEQLRVTDVILFTPHLFIKSNALTVTESKTTRIYTVENVESFALIMLLPRQKK